MTRKRSPLEFRKQQYLQGLLLQETEYVIHLFTEGETELRYVEDLARNKCVKIRLEWQNSNPNILYKKALDWTRKHTDFFKSTKEKARHVVWVLFDDDEKTDLIEKTAELVRANQGSRWPISIGYQKPCIELWAALCVKGNASGLPGMHSAMESALARLMHGYDHNANRYFDLGKMSHTDAACTLARQWESTYGAFPKCTGARYYACIHGLVELIRGTTDKVR